MNQIKDILRTYSQQITLFFIMACLVSVFFYGHAVESLTVLGFVVFSLMSLMLGVSTLHRRPLMFWVIILYYLFIIISGLWTVNSLVFWDKIILKSTLIAIPFCFLVQNPLKEKYVDIFTKSYVVLILVSTCYVLGHLFLDYTQILEGLKEGRPMPVPMRSHIRYSILVTVALILALQKFNSIHHRVKKISLVWLLVSLYLIIFIHVLAVKVGIVICFIILISFSVHKILQSKKFFLGIWILASFLTFSLFAITNIPSLKNKLGYFRYDVTMFKNQMPKNYSDSERILSIQEGIKIAKQHWLLGVGEGGIYSFITLMKPDNEPILPHNQFIMTWASYGIVGLLLLCMIFLMCILKSVRERNWMLFAYTFSMLFAFMIEPMLETQIGVLVFVLPLCYFYQLKFVYK